MKENQRFNRKAILEKHTLALGIFHSNVSSGAVVSNLPERWKGTWEENLQLAKLAEEGGLDFILPLARWKGYGGDTDYQGESLETITWATGMLAHTKRLQIFSTIHAPLFHPVAAAKQMATADLLGEGRLSLNLVCGWNVEEFGMFGADMREHEARYEYAQEWLDIVKRVWTSHEQFDFTGRFFDLRGVIGKPHPFGSTIPLIMNAGASAVGREFAARNCELFFTGASHGTPAETWIHSIQNAKAQALRHRRDIDVLTVASVTCRASDDEAIEFFEYTRSENADWSAIDAMLLSRGLLEGNHSPEEIDLRRRNLANGYGSPAFVGSPDTIAAELAKLSYAGIKGLGLDFFHYVDELPYFIQEVIPRLVRLGLRSSV